MSNQLERAQKVEQEISHALDMIADGGRYELSHDDIEWLRDAQALTCRTVNDASQGKSIF